MGIISYLSELISYNAVVSIILASIVLLVFMLSDYYYYNESEHDKELFKQPPVEDCPICFLRIPILRTGNKYMTCCGKRVCSGCTYAVEETRNTSIPLCPFCRTPAPTSEEEANERMDKRVDADDAIAAHLLGFDYTNGTGGYPQDYTKALEMWHRAVELGYYQAYGCIGSAYSNGHGVEVDKKKTKHYLELAAIAGCVQSRFNLGIAERNRGNFDRALKHYIIAARGGDADTLKNIQEMYSTKWTCNKRRLQKSFTIISNILR